MQAAAPVTSAWPALLAAALLFHAILIVEHLAGLLPPVSFAVRGICITVLLLTLLLRPAGFGRNWKDRALLVLTPALLIEALLDKVPFANMNQLFLAQTGAALLLLMIGWSIVPGRRWVALAAGSALVANAASLLLGPAAQLAGVPIILASLWAPGFAAAIVLLLSVVRHNESRREFLMLRQAAFAGTQAAPAEGDTRHLDLETGIASRLAFDMRFRAAWDAAAGRRSPVALLFFSIDAMAERKRELGFKFVEMLQRQVANLLKDGLRRSDDMVARFDHQHFVVMLPGVGRDGATQIAERLRGNVEGMGVYAGQKRHIATVTVGAASIRAKRGIPREQLVDGAINALEQAHATGPNTVCVEGVGCVPRMS